MTATEIKQLRERLGWSQTQLGSQLHVSAMSVSSWETGSNRPDPYREAALIQLRDRLNAIDTERRRQEFISGLAAAAIGAGVIGLLTYLFEKNDD